MTVYVAEIDGRAVVAFNADNDLEAELAVEDEIFQNDLAVLESSGRPLWDGEAEIHIREADEDERSSTVREPKQFSKVRSERGNVGRCTWCPLVTPPAKQPGFKRRKAARSPGRPAESPPSERETQKALVAHVADVGGGGGKIPSSHHGARTIFGTNPQLNHWDGGASVLTSPRAPQTHQDGRALSPLSRTKSPRSKT